MGLIVLFAFIAIPLIEIGLFIEVGGQIGLWPTIIVVVVTAIVGTSLLRIQGLSALNRLQNSLNAGQAPLAPVFDGFCLLAAGFLLLTPGFFTDFVGFLLFMPLIRSSLRRFVEKRINIQSKASDRMHNQPFASSAPNFEDIIDGEWQDITPNDKSKDKDKAGGKPEKQAKIPPKDDAPLD